MCTLKIFEYLHNVSYKYLNGSIEDLIISMFSMKILTEKKSPHFDVTSMYMFVLKSFIAN